MSAPPVGAWLVQLVAAATFRARRPAIDLAVEATSALQTRREGATLRPAEALRAVADACQEATVQGALRQAGTVRQVSHAQRAARVEDGHGGAHDHRIGDGCTPPVRHRREE